MSTYTNVFLMVGLAIIFITLAVVLPNNDPQTTFMYVDTPQGTIPCVVVHGNHDGLSCDWNRK